MLADILINPLNSAKFVKLKKIYANNTKLRKST